MKWLQISHLNANTNEWPHRMVNCVIFPAFSFGKMTHFHKRNIAVSCLGSGGDDVGGGNSILYHNWKSHLRGQTENRKQSKKTEKKIEKEARKIPGRHNNKYGAHKIVEWISYVKSSDIFTVACHKNT